MKKLFTLSLILFLAASFAEAQVFTIGPKFGISNTNLDLRDNVAQYEAGDARYSFHGGVFARIKITGFYVQPEVYFNGVRGQYIDSSRPAGDQTVEFNRNKVDVPVLFGWKMGPLRINAGPVASFGFNGLDTEIPSVDEYKSAVFAYQAGIGLDVSKLTVDLRYEGNLSDQASLSAGGNVRVNQIMLSVGYKIIN